MTEKTLADEIITIVNSVANNNPAPNTCTIRKIYDDGFVDVTLKDGGVVSYLECYGRTEVGNNALIVFADGDISNGKVVSIDNYTKAEIDEMISGGADLTRYVKKEDVDLKFSLEDNGQIIIGLDVGDGF